MIKTDNGNILSEKKRVRKEILEKLRSQNRETILRKSSIIKERLFKLKEFIKARCVIFYVSMQGEVDTHKMIDESIRMGKTVGVPVVISSRGKKGEKELIISRITDRIRQLEIGPYGVGQPRLDEIRPIPHNEMELVLVPGLGFDRHGKRLGRGKGYYDRFLKKVPDSALTVGLCFDFQVAGSVPTLPHDVPVQMLLSNI